MFLLILSDPDSIGNVHEPLEALISDTMITYIFSLHVFIFFFVHRSERSLTVMDEAPDEDKLSDVTDLSAYVPAPAAIFWCTLFILEAVFIAIGNLLTTVLFLRSRKLRKRRHYLVINLAISDTLVGALAMPLFIVPFGEALKLWKISAINAYAVMFFDMFTGFASIAFLTMISLERLYATLRPFCYRALKSRWYVLLTVIAWASAGCIPSIHLLVLNYHSSTQDIMMVSLWVPFLSAQLLIICTSYLMIWRKVKIVNRNVGKKRAVEKESSLSRICLLVTAMSLVAWLPFVVVSMILNSSPGMMVVDVHVIYITKVLHYANSLLNPVLYVVKIPEFKASLTHLFNRNAADASTIDLNVPLSPKMSVPPDH